MEAVLMRQKAAETCRCDQQTFIIYECICWFLNNGYLNARHETRIKTIIWFLIRQIKLHDILHLLGVG